MRRNISGNRHSLAVWLLALVGGLVIITAGCGKIKEEFERGMEAGKERAAQEKNANTNSSAPKPEPTPLVLTAGNLSDKKLTNLGAQPWQYKPGDDASWAQPSTDDRDWERVSPAGIQNFLLPKSGWDGIGWFRLRLDVDQSLAGQPLGLTIAHQGASEIYIDGQLAQSYGTVSADANAEKTFNPLAIPFGVTLAPGTHLIAVRYSNTQGKKYVVEMPAFQMQVVPLNTGIAAYLKEATFMKGIRGGTFGICLALGLLHLLLFALYPRQLENLFYSLFLLSEALNIAITETIAPGGVYASVFTGTLIGMIYFTSFLAYLYTVLENRQPRYLRLMLGVWLLSFITLNASFLGFGTLISVLLFFAGFLTFLGLMFWSSVSVLIVIVRAVRRKIDNSLILGLVGASFIASGLSSTVLAIVFGENKMYLYTSQFICLTALIVANAALVARQFARTSTDLEVQLVKEVEHEKEKSRLLIVEAENDRRAKELEEARQLQLSLLPRKLPVIPGLEIAAYMKPATEVGGDYYDFHLSKDGTLTVAVGDATGHGLKAGSVVTATKSLFNAFAEQKDIPLTLKQTSGALKKMNLRGLFMAMAMLKIKDGVMNLSIAGMPSVLIYRAANKTIEEISLRAMPLGSVSKVEYQQSEIALASGDCVVLMSDGFPEMFNPENEILGFDKAAEVLPSLAGSSPQEIINYLVETGERWANGRPADDDVTFVVLKVKNDAIWN